MKHILFGLAAVLFASSVALADDQLTAQVKPASAEAEHAAGMGQEAFSGRTAKEKWREGRQSCGDRRIVQCLLYY